MNIIRIAHIFLSLAACVAALLIANRPRFWWQEVFHNLSLYWTVPALLLGVYFFVRACVRRQGALLSLVVSGCYLYAGCCMAWRVWPYVFFDRWPPLREDSESIVRGVWIDSWTDRDDLESRFRELERYRPEILIISGSDVDAIDTVAMVDRYPHRTQLEGADGVELVLYSQYAFGPNQYLNLGLNARVGGFIPLQVGPSKIVQLGLLVLTPSTSRRDFEQNRISSRRLSSLIRNSSEARLVVGNFSATPFSQLVAVYTEHAKVRALRFGLGFRELVRLGMYTNYLSPPQVFASKEVSRRVFEEITLSGRDRPAIFFEVGIPGAELK